MESLHSNIQKEANQNISKRIKAGDFKEKNRENYIRSQKIKSFTYAEKQLIIGSLLGDGYLHITKDKNSISTYLVLEHGIKQLDYLLWKGIQLERLDAKFYQYYKYNNVKHRVTTRNQVRTKSLFIIGWLKNIFYKETPEGSIKKYINPEILKHLDAPGIAIWFMDDGTTYASGGSIATQSFSVEDNEMLCEFFKNKFKIEPHINFDTKNMPFLKFNTIEFKKLCDLIRPYMFYQLLYKIDKIPQKEELVVSKRVIFDSCHFLDEYDGKCSNLHGGRYELWVSVKGPINPDTGMVVDYGYMKTIIDKYIVSEFDHHCLNYVDSQLSWRSTTELLCMYIWKVLIEFFPGLYKLELHETEGSKCSYIGPSIKDMKNDKSLEILNTFKEKNLDWRQRIITDFKTLFSNVDCGHENIQLQETLEDGTIVFKSHDEIFEKKNENSLITVGEYVKKLNNFKDKLIPCKKLQSEMNLS